MACTDQVQTRHNLFGSNWHEHENLRQENGQNHLREGMLTEKERHPWPLICRYWGEEDVQVRKSEKE